jgi:hypothetical protein
MTNCRFTSVALFELKEGALYYEQKENGLGIIFLDEIDATSNESCVFHMLGIPCQHGPDAAALTASHSVCFIKFDQMRF